jgi:hypothetical protein
MKKLRNFYLIAGLAALAFGLLAKHIPGITVTDFVYGFCWGLAITLLVAGLITASIPVFCRKTKDADHAAGASKTASTSAAHHAKTAPESAADQVSK